jgi:hypothetical protein
MIRRSLLASITIAAVFAALAIGVVAADTELPWSAFGGGGGSVASTNYAIGGTAGQPIGGAAQSANYALGASYWAGITDTDSDGVFDATDLDDDGDGYKDTDEALIGTNRAYPCGLSGWPSNLIDPVPPSPANTLDIFDVTSFLGPDRRLDTNLSAFEDNSRWDLLPGPGVFGIDINISDLAALFTGDNGGGAFPPMFGGQRAFDRTCPLPP